jgi:hypothetical protein
MEPPLESKFTKSLRNKGTENAGLALLLQDPRIHTADLLTKRRILELIGGTEGMFGIQTFDAVMTEEPVDGVGLDNIEEVFPQLTLLEMKTTRKRIRNSDLSGFFFGATEREYQMASTLGDRYLFAFVVLNSDNDYGTPFAVLLDLEEVEERTRSRRTQFQVTFRTDLKDLPATRQGLLLARRHPAELGE